PFCTTLFPYTTLFRSKMYVMERWLRADYSLVKAWKGDTNGNLVYNRTARNFNPLMAMAGTITIAEVEHLVEPGEIDPDHVHTPRSEDTRLNSSHVKIS